MGCKRFRTSTCIVLSLGEDTECLGFCVRVVWQDVVQCGVPRACLCPRETLLATSYHVSSCPVDSAAEIRLVSWVACCGFACISGKLEALRRARELLRSLASASLAKTPPEEPSMTL